MLEQVAAAFESKNYRTAAELLQELVKESPDNPWVQFYLGRLDEVSGKIASAEKIYRQLLRDTTNSKIMLQARQSLQRLEEIKQEQKQQAIAQAIADPNNTKLGVLVLEPIASENKPQAAQKLAQIINTDPYTARLQLPSRGWRLYRTGAIGELRLLGQNLREAGIDCFWATLSEIREIQVLQVRYFQSTEVQASVVYQNEQNQIESLVFNWSEITQRVTGLLPIFEQVVDLDPHGKLKHKTQTQDYVQVYDLHLVDRGCILRICDRTYQFQHSVDIASESSHFNQTTVRINWNSLVSVLDQHLAQTRVFSDFTTFAETVLDQTDFLTHIVSHIHLFRRDTTNWDPAFQLYSGLAFIRGQEK